MAVNYLPQLRNMLGDECKYFVRTRSGNNPEKRAFVLENDVQRKGISQIYLKAYEDFIEAFNSARDFGIRQEEWGYDQYDHYMLINAKETGGFVFGDDSALEMRDLSTQNNLVIEYNEDHTVKSTAVKPRAWHLNIFYDRSNNNYNYNDEIVIHYHYHPNNNCNLSTYDKNYLNHLKSYAQYFYCEVIILDDGFVIPILDM